MNRNDLEHIIRAVSAITDDQEMIIIGSQAILATYPTAPAELLVSMEADVYPRHKPESSIQIDGAIGERSLFHETFGYYAHGVDETTATLPKGWKDRLVSICNENTRNATGWCLEVHDLAVSKLVAGREKDVHFVRVLVRDKLVDLQTLRDRVQLLSVTPEERKLVEGRLEVVLRDGGTITD